MTDTMTDIVMMQIAAIMATKLTTMMKKEPMMMTDCCHTLSPQKDSLQNQRHRSCGFVQTPPSHQMTACQHLCRTGWLPAPNSTTVFSAFEGAGYTSVGQCHADSGEHNPECLGTCPCTML